MSQSDTTRDTNHDITLALHAMLAATTQALRQHPGTQAYLLADGAWIQHGSAPMRALWSRIQGTPLLGDSEAGWAGPLLFTLAPALAPDSDDIEPLRLLLDPDNMLPAGSILCSAMERSRLSSTEAMKTSLMWTMPTTSSRLSP